MRFAKLTPIVAILALAACDNQPETTAEAPVIQEEGTATEQQTTEMAPAPTRETEPAVTAERETTEEAEVTVVEPEPQAGTEMAETQPIEAQPTDTQAAETTEIEPVVEGGEEAEVTVITPEGEETQTTTAATTPEGETTGAISATTAAMVEPGSYASDQLSLNLAENGGFTLTGPGGDEVTGDWRVFGDTMTLSNTSGATGDADFPMTCTVAEEGEGFRITAETGSCEMLDGQVFQPQS